MRKKKNKAISDLAFLFVMTEMLLDGIKYGNKEEITGLFLGIAQAVGGLRGIVLLNEQIAVFRERYYGLEGKTDAGKSKAVFEE